MKQIRKRLTYANVMSSIAVFLMLGGATAFAATKIGANQLKANSVKTGKIVKEAVKAGKIAKGAVSTEKIADLAVTTPKIANDAVTGEKANESTFGQVPSAATAATAGIGQSPVAFAHVNSEGTVIAADSRGIAQSNVSLEATSAYCFHGLSFPFKSAMAVADYGDPVTGGLDDQPQVTVALGNPFEDCASSQLEVAGENNGGFTPEGFFIWFYN